MNQFPPFQQPQDHNQIQFDPQQLRTPQPAVPAGYDQFAAFEKKIRRRQKILGFVVALATLAGVFFVWKSTRPGPGQADAEAALKVAKDFSVTSAAGKVKATDLCRKLSSESVNIYDQLATKSGIANPACSQLSPSVVKTTMLQSGGAEQFTPSRVEFKGSTGVALNAQSFELFALSKEKSGNWQVDPIATGASKWRLNTSLACSAALNDVRSNPIVDLGSINVVADQRIELVNKLDSQLGSEEVPAQVRSTVVAVRGPLHDYRDGLQAAAKTASNQSVDITATSSATMPSALQLLQISESMAKAGVSCLVGERLSNDAIVQGNAACDEIRVGIDEAFRDISESESTPAIADGYTHLAQQWQMLADALEKIDFGQSAKLQSAKQKLVTSARAAAAKATEVAASAQARGGFSAIADQLSQHEKLLMDGMLSIGFRSCGLSGL